MVPSYSILKGLIAALQVPDDIALVVEFLMVESESTQSFNRKFLILSKVSERCMFLEILTVEISCIVTRVENSATRINSRVLSFVSDLFVCSSDNSFRYVDDL